MCGWRFLAQQSQCPQVRDYTTAKRRQVIAALQTADDTTVRPLIGDLNQLLSEPSIISFHQLHCSKVILAVRVKTGGNKDHLGLVLIQCRQPVLLYEFAYNVSPRASRDWDVHQVFRCATRRINPGVGVERMLKELTINTCSFPP